MTRRKLPLFVVVGVWLATAAAGITSLAVYANKPGDAAISPVSWPANIGFARAEGRATLVVALHPACSCSRATLEQLDRIAGRKPGALDIVALMAGYDGLPAGADALGPTLSHMRHVRRIDDRRARIARRFGALTSGHALLYDEEGRLRFSGGLTRTRGHAGDSAGLEFVLGWIEGQREAAAATTAVFGCALGRGAQVSAS